MTQLKRKLRIAQKERLGLGKLTKPKLETIDYEEKLNFNLQTPAVKVNEVNAWKSSQDSEQVASSGSSQTSGAILEKHAENKASTSEDKAST